MEITKITKGDNWELMVPGRIDGAAAHQLEVEILGAIKAGAREVFINLSQAEWMFRRASGNSAVLPSDEEQRQGAAGHQAVGRCKRNPGDDRLQRRDCEGNQPRSAA
jgi:hypothetical protein